MKRIIKAAPLLLMFAASEARAGCDACIQASVEKASASISASLNSLKTTVDTNVQATNQLKVTVDTSNSTMVGLLNAQQQQMLTTLDGVAAKLSLSQEKLGVTIRNLTDYTVNEINLAIKNQTKTEGFIDNSKEFGPLAHPVSNDITVNRAEHLKVALVELNGLLDDSVKKFQSWALVVGESDSTSSLRAKKVNEKIEELTPLLDLLHLPVISIEDTSSLLNLMKLLVLPNPQKISDLSEVQKIAYFSEIAKKSAAYRALASEVINKAALLSIDGWDIGYTQVTALDGKTSIEEFIASETERKLVSEDWHLDVKTKSDTGLIREQINQMNITNFLLNEIIKQERLSLAMEANK